jgi:hypothetical protein
MRYYAVIIPGAPATFPARYDGGGVWGSHINGVADPGAQQIEIHIEEMAFNVPTPDSVITVHGVSWDQIRTTDQIIGLPIVVNGGMMPGLPLATLQSVKRGTLLTGRIFRAWGNWIGTDMSIGIQFQVAGADEKGEGGESSSGGGDASGGSGPSSDSGSPAMVLGTQRQRISRRVGFRSIDNRGFSRGATTPFGGGPPTASASSIGDIGQFSGSNVFGAATTEVGGVVSSLFGGGSQGLQAPLNLIHNLMPGMNLSGAISETLGRAFSQGGANIGISDALKLNYQDAGMYQNMQQYAQYIQKFSQSILGIKNYPGVNMTSKGQGINVWDATKVLGWGQIDYTDLIGQPTWIEIQKIQVKCIMRGDIQCGYHVTVPPGLYGLSPTAIVTHRPGVALNTLQVNAFGVPIGQGSPQRDNVSIPGAGVVTKVLHVGDFRNPDGVGWSTTYDILIESALPQLPFIGLASQFGGGAGLGITDPSLILGGQIPPILLPPRPPGVQSNLLSRRGVQVPDPGIVRIRRGRRVN